MKLLDLQLKAFGPFTEKELDFSGGGLQVIFGPNEAGKSSALRAISGFLYGIPARSADNFVHENKALRIGATVESSSGRKKMFLRRKGNKDTLLDGEGNPAADSALEPFVGTVNEDLFLNMFGLSHQRLIDGGREIVHGKGDVGQSIFSAGLGIVSLRRVLEELGQREVSLFKPAGQVPEINKLVTAFNQAKQEVRTLSLSAKAYQEAANALAGAEARRVELTGTLSDLVNQIDRLERIQKAAPRVARLASIESEIEALGEVAFLAEDFSERRGRNQRERQEAATEIASLNSELSDLQTRIQSHPVETCILELDGDILGLIQSRGTYEKNQKDLPALRQKHQNLQDEARRLLRKLGLPDDLDRAEEFRLSNPQRARIVAATDELRSLQERIGAAERHLQDTATEVAEMEAKLDEMPEIQAVESLQGLLKLAAGEGDLARRRDELFAEETTTQTRAARKLKRLLPPLSGDFDLESLETLPAPSAETIDRFEGEARKMNQEEGLLEDRVAELEGRLETNRANAEAVKQGGRVPTEEELRGARDRRDHGWRLVRFSWEGAELSEEEVAAFACGQPLGDAYEATVRETDRVADELRRESDRVAQLQQLVDERRRLEEQIDTARKAREAHAGKATGWTEEWRRLWEPTGVEPLTPAEMRSWRDEYDALVEMSGVYRERREKRKQLDAAIEDLRERLVAEGGKAGLPAFSAKLPFGELLARVDETVETIQRKNHERETARRDLVAAEKRRDRQSAALEGLKKEEEEARNKWGETVAVLNLSKRSTPAEARAILGDIGDVFQKLDEAKGIQDTISNVERDCQNFKRGVEDLLTRLKEESAEPVVPQETIVKLHQRLTDSQTHLAALEDLRTQVENRKRRLAEAELRHEGLEETLKRLLEEAGVEEESMIAAVEATSEKARRLEQAAETERKQLHDFSGGGTVEEWIAVVQGVEPETLPGEIEGMKVRRNELDQELTVLNEEIGVLRQNLAALDGSATAAVKAEEMEETLAALRGKIEEFARVRLASLLLRREVERYRQEHQGPVLKRAGEVFAALTLGSFAGLTTDFDEKDRQILVGLRADGGTVTVDGMSDGACDQLYLALRLASLEHHVEDHEPMPLILDDILVNFDDRRSRAALQILAELAKKSQVIYFTHHRHITEIARSLPRDLGISFHVLGDDEVDAVSEAEMPLNAV